MSLSGIMSPNGIIYKANYDKEVSNIMSKSYYGNTDYEEHNSDSEYESSIDPDEFEEFQSKFESSVKTEVKDLAVLNHFQNETKSNNSSGQLVCKNTDTFMMLIEYIYNTYDFTELDNFYANTKRFKRNLDESLLDYYNYLGLKNIKKQEEIIIELINHICTYNSSFINLIFDKPDICNSINSYFMNKKNNLHELDPEHNDGYIISHLQLEWCHRLFHMKNYYSKIVELNSKPLEKRVQKKSILSDAFKAISYYLGDTENKNQSAIKIV